MYRWVTFRITQENMSDAPPLSGCALTPDLRMQNNILGSIPAPGIHSTQKWGTTYYVQSSTKYKSNNIDMVLLRFSVVEPI